MTSVIIVDIGDTNDTKKEMASGGSVAVVRRLITSYDAR